MGQSNLADEFEVIVRVAFQQILAGLEACYNVDTQSENFKDTPFRAAKAYREILSGLENTDQKVKEILARTFPGDSTEMLVCGPVHVWSLCPHHFLPVELNVWIGYLPKKRLLGLSKIARLAQVIASAPAMQEDTTRDIAITLFEELDPLGVGCHVQGRHLCMAMRGVKQDSVFSSTALVGEFEKQEVKSEFLDAVRRNQNGK